MALNSFNYPNPRDAEQTFRTCKVGVPVMHSVLSNEKGRCYTSLSKRELEGVFEKSCYLCFLPFLQRRQSFFPLEAGYL